MQRTITSLALTALSVEARRSRTGVSDDHPFMNSEHSVVFHKEGGSSHLAEPVVDGFRKYDSIISDKQFKKTHKSPWTKSYEFFFGESNEQTPLE